MNRVAIDFGIIQIYWYSLFILTGMMIGMFLVYSECKKKKISENLITNLIFYTVIISIIGARIYYVIFNWDYYSRNILEVFEIWNGGLAIHGAIILGGLYLILYTKKHKMNVLKVLDVCSVGLIIGQAIGRWGNFFNQEAYGSEVSLEFLKGLHLPGFIIDGMHINGTYYHPTFLYESLWCIIGFIILMIIRRRKYIKTGQIFGLYCMWYSIGRFFIEGLRTDSLMLGSLKMAQIVSIGMFLVGLFFFIRRFKSSRFEFLYNDDSIISSDDEKDKKKSYYGKFNNYSNYNNPQSNIPSNNNANNQMLNINENNIVTNTNQTEQNHNNMNDNMLNTNQVEQNYNNNTNNDSNQLLNFYNKLNGNDNNTSQGNNQGSNKSFFN